MKGKKGLVMGVANDHSIAWGMAEALHQAGAEMAFTYQGDAFGKRVKPLAESIGAKILIDCDVQKEEDLDRVFATLKKEWGTMDFLIHAIAYSNKEELQGHYVDTTLNNFLQTMHISCYSFTSIMRRAKDMMSEGGSAVTLTYYGSMKVMPNYNVMGVAKAALEASVRYLAADLGPPTDQHKSIRVNAISAGPMRTLAGAVIGSARKTYKYNIVTAPLRKPVDLQDLGGTALYLLSDLSNAVTGEVHYVDCGFNAVGMPLHEQLKDLAG
ncbi:MAG: SDR family oxidoreductase [Alphaproteobacteria bacterium]|nr:SDR family oxidoreductase [Alphaproteobacteria bacterium]MBP7759264.1 SDR family oxidoreductase [Alphaproteobacteria bacterium]MBP7761898.1 SDR family oxidoreductase [Alphaproteobacteria bacterium]MBP7905971.1 SDR family oxidoreductase [Alphaproteobacteria bacterium]